MTAEMRPDPLNRRHSALCDRPTWASAMSDGAAISCIAPPGLARTATRPNPLQIRGVPAVQRHGQQARWRQPTAPEPVLMLLANSSARRTAAPSAAYALRRWRRNSSSNSASWSDEWSSPYHQNQSLPSAIRISSNARSRDAASTSAARVVERHARGRQLRPRALVVAMADPDIEVAVDPRSRKDASATAAPGPPPPRPWSPSGCRWRVRARRRASRRNGRPPPG